MTKDEALALVCEVAYSWAEEYGFADPKGAIEVYEAARTLRPDLQPVPNWPDKETSLQNISGSTP